MGFFRKKTHGRALKNGAQQEIIVQCPDNTVSDPAWWGDLYRLVHGLSDGDKSTFVAAMQAAEAGDSANLITVEGSVTNALWTRLSLLGYFEPAPLSEDMQALPNPPSAHRLTPFGVARACWFIGAAQALMKDLEGDTGRVVRFADSFLRLNKLHKGIRIENLNLMRDMLFRNEQGVQAAGNEAFSVILQRYGAAGAMRDMGDDRWDVTAAGAMIGPFMLDRIVAQRQRH